MSFQGTLTEYARLPGRFVCIGKGKAYTGPFEKLPCMGKRFTMTGKLSTHYIKVGQRVDEHHVEFATVGFVYELKYKEAK